MPLPVTWSVEPYRSNIELQFTLSGSSATITKQVTYLQGVLGQSPSGAEMLALQYRAATQTSGALKRFGNSLAFASSLASVVAVSGVDNCTRCGLLGRVFRNM